MKENNSVVAIYASHTTAEVAVKELQRRYNRMLWFEVKSG
jgi:thiamine phosphate synthase YjbQ (UPF0047 family)